MTVASQTTNVTSGSPAVYTITVQPKNARAQDVTVKISALSGNASPALPAPVFTVCGSGDKTQVCTLGTMRTTQVSQLQAQVSVPRSAASGDTVTLVAKVAGAAPHATSEGSVTGSATTNVVAPKPTKSPSPSPSPTSSGGHHPGPGHSSGPGSHSGSGSGSGSGVGVTIPPGSGSGGGVSLPFGNIPPLISTASGGTGPSLSSSGNTGGLFPTISPSSPSASGSAATTGKSAQRPYRASTVADVLPLNPGQLGGQVAGLIVLGLGIALVFARISLRKPRGSESDK